MGGESRCEGTTKMDNHWTWYESSTFERYLRLFRFKRLPSTINAGLYIGEQSTNRTSPCTEFADIARCYRNMDHEDTAAL